MVKLGSSQIIFVEVITVILNIVEGHTNENEREHSGHFFFQNGS